ncbi:MAG: succinate dehydrogenase, cytochrome b556 subunit [Pseudomonadota bacterium]
MTGTQRPKHLDLRVIRLPVTGVASILHRLSGLLLVLVTPVLIALLARSLEDPAGFEATRELLTSAPARAALVLLAWALGHHLFAGIRYLLLDLDIGIERPAARAGAWLVNGGGVVVALLALWGVLA